MLKLLAVIIPLGLDAFAAAAILTIAGLTDRDRHRVMVVFPLFETLMPIVGLLIGIPLRGLGHAAADSIGALILIVVAVLILREWREADHEPAALTGSKAITATVALGLAISVDELAIGLSLGLLGLPLAATLILIAVQAIVFSQLGLRAGARLGRRWAKDAQLAAAVVLLITAAVLLLQ